jgi:hypothetical protein
MALSVVGIIEWLKQIVKVDVKIYAGLLPFVAIGVGFSQLVPQLYTGLQIWAMAQLTYPILVQLPARIIKGNK